MSANPLAQFEVKRLTAEPLLVGGFDISFTNASLFMVVVVTVASLFLGMGVRRAAIVPGRWQSIVEMSYEFIANMVRDNVGNEGRRYFPFIFTLFIFILTCNLVGMVPYSFTVTSHIIVTFALAAVVFLGVTFIGFMCHGMAFLKMFAPGGVPLWLMPMLIVIEVISYMTRPISLSVRLFANMTAGHTIMKVFAGFVVSMGAAGGALTAAAALPFAFEIFLIGLEFLVAFLQAYVFTVLTCLYLNDAIHMHH
ncbi:MAG: F0F1 ATP synthase subunit A [Kordiimonas sp.]|nr:F0F1 ATP synthase subunit A [Kordiimonas sp.]